MHEAYVLFDLVLFLTHVLHLGFVLSVLEKL